MSRLKYYCFLPADYTDYFHSYSCGLDQGIIDYTGTETWQTFSRMLTMEELFTPTLNGIAVSVR